MYKKTKIIYFFLIFLFISSCKDGQETLAPEKFKTLLESADVQLVDIRTPAEFESGYIEKAININFYETNFLDQMLTLDKQKPLAIYCKEGERTKKAMKQLGEAGFQQIISLDGGMDAWLIKGYAKQIPEPVVPEKRVKLSYSLEEYNELISKDELVFIEFSAVWCGPCKLLKPVLDKLTTEYSGKPVKIITIDVDQSKDLSNHLKINEIPLMYFYKNKELKEKFIGFTPEEVLKKTIDKYL